MIVNDDTVSKALQYLAVDPHPIALARKDVTDAENALEGLEAKLFMQFEGTLKERESLLRTDERYVALQYSHTEATFELERHKARVRAAEMIIEVWRSEQANVRAAERVR